MSRPRRAGRTVALVGPDGAGKSTIVAAALERLGPSGAVVYMGINPCAATVALPTTRWLARRHRRRAAGVDGGPPARPTADGATGRRWRPQSDLLVLNLLLEEQYRQLVVAWYRWRGRVVLLDRDFLVDHWVHEVTRPDAHGPVRRLHGHVLRHWYRRPDALVCLDAPVAVLAARRPDVAEAELAARRAELDRAGRDLGAVVVDASRPLPVVLDEVLAVVATGRPASITR